MRIIIFIIIIFHTFTLAFSNNDDIYDKVDLFGEVLDKVNKEYVEEIDQAEAMDAAIDGVLRSLDPYLHIYHQRILNKWKPKQVVNLGD